MATVPVGDMPNGISYSSRRVTAGMPTTVEIEVPDYADGDEDGHEDQDEEEGHE